MWQSTRRVVERMHRERPIEAVLSYWIHPDGDAALRAAQRLGVPSAVTVGGSDVLLLPNEPKRCREIRRVLNATDVVLTVSEGLRNAVLALDIDPAKVHTVYQGIDDNVFHPGSKSAARDVVNVPMEAETLLWVGRMVDVKRLDLLIAAFAIVVAARPNALLCLVGSGPRLVESRQRVADAGIVNNVRFVGAVAPEALGHWYRAADFTVLSSDSEGLPNVLRESLACGTPYVTTDVGDIREIDTGHSGKFVSPGNARLFAEAILGALDGRANALRAECSPRTWRDMADEIVSLMQTRHSPLTPALSPASESRSLSSVHHGGEGADKTLIHMG
jgi:glycosyltransferase involved in cell wall biosynthesis